jgi:hypothetical protein
MVALKCMMLQSIVASPSSDVHELQTLVHDLEKSGDFEKSDMGDVMKAFKLKGNSIQKTGDAACDTSDTGKAPGSFDPWNGLNWGDVDTALFIDACLVKQEPSDDVAESKISADCLASAAKGAGNGGICEYKKYVFDFYKEDDEGGKCKDMKLYAVKSKQSCEQGFMGWQGQPHEEEGWKNFEYPGCVSDYWNAANPSADGTQMSGSTHNADGSEEAGTSYRSRMAICESWNTQMNAYIEITMSADFNGEQVFIGPGQSASSATCLGVAHFPGADEIDWASETEQYPVDPAKQIVFCPLSCPYPGCDRKGFPKKYPNTEIRFVETPNWCSWADKVKNRC